MCVRSSFTSVVLLLYPSTGVHVFVTLYSTVSLSNILACMHDIAGRTVPGNKSASHNGSSYGLWSTQINGGGDLI